jgi:hypothetical protein
MKKTIAMATILALALVAFAGFIIAEEPALTEPVVTVTDTFAPFDDTNAYVGDTYTFTVDGYGAAVNNSNVSVTIKIGPLDAAPMTWNGTLGKWVYEFTFPVDPAYVGTHDVVFTATDAGNASNMNMTTVQITLWHPVFYNDAYVMPTFTEDTETAWNLSSAFLPEMDVTGAGLEFGVGPEGFPTGWTFTPMMDGEYTHWHVTPPMDFNGMAQVNVTVEDTNGVGTYKMFDLNVVAVNDMPMIEGIMVGETLLEPEMYNYTWTEGENTTMWDHREVINLSLMEDGELEFMVKAMDVDMDELVYEYMMYMDTDPYEVMHTEYVMDDNGTNVTYTVPYNFTLVPDMDANGMFWGMMNVSDATHWDIVWIIVMVEAVNDAPTATENWDMVYDRKTGEEINLTVSNIADIDGDDVTVMWYIDGTMVSGWTEIYFMYTWEAAGTYNVSAKISDGTETVDVGYFMVNVTVANTAPTISLVQAIPKGMGALDVIKFLVDGEVEEGKDVVITCTAIDLDGDTLSYVWTNDVDAAWTQTTTTGELTVSADDLEVGKSYTFTCKVTDGKGGEATLPSNTIKIVEEDEPSDITTIIIIVIAVIAILAIIIILFFVLKGGKKEEEAPVVEETETPEEGMPEEEGMMGEESLEEGMPEEEGMGEPTEEEALSEEPLEGETEETEEVPAPPAPPQ